MSILLGLTPFIVFFVLMRLVHPLVGLGAAFAVSLLMGFVQWRRGEKIKVLEVGSLVLFGVLTLYTLIAAPQWSVATVRLAVDGGLFIIAAVSLLIRQPFTLQYARESVPQELWTSPIFFTTNVRITAVWTAAFAIASWRAVSSRSANSAARSEFTSSMLRYAIRMVFLPGSWFASPRRGSSLHRLQGN